MDKKFAYGVLLGQTVGDAVGFPVEGMNQTYCFNYVQNELDDNEDIPNRVYLDPGQYTDDSQLARELLLSIKDKHGFDPEHFGQRIVNIFETGKIVGYGIATQKAAYRLSQGVPWSESGEKPPSAGNGTAMRSASISFVSDDEEEIEKICELSSSITHQDPRCIAGSVLMAFGARYLASIGSQDVDLKIDEFVNYLDNHIKPISPLFSRELNKIPNLIDKPVIQAAETVSKYGDPDMKNGGWELISPYVIPSVLWSLLSFLKSPNNYTQTINTAISCGGDVDTTGAMAGALSGAYLGKEAIPKKWLDNINDKGKWKANDLISLVDDIYELKEKGELVHNLDFNFSG